MVGKRYPFYSVASVVAMIVLWQLASTYLIDPFFLPAPTAVVKGTGELLREGILLKSIGASLGRIFAGWILGSLAAIPVGLLVGSSPVVRSLVDPFTHFFRFIPALALITLFIVWFGVGELSKILLIVYSTGFIVMINTATGVAAIPEEKICAARCLGANRRQLFLHVTAPATVPYIYVGMRLAMASSFLVIVAAEMLAANSGLGYLIWTSRLYFRIDWMFAGIVLLGLLGYGTDRLWRLVGSTLLARYLREVSRY